MIIEIPAPRFFAISEVLPQIRKHEENNRAPNLYGYKKNNAYLLTLQSGKTLRISPSLSAVARFEHALHCCECGCNATHIQSYIQQQPNSSYEVFRVMTWSVAGNRPSFLNVDHIIPKSLGGSNHISNFRITCDYCNTKRGNDMSHVKNIDQSTIISQAQIDKMREVKQIKKPSNKVKSIKVSDFLDLVYTYFDSIENFNKLSNKIETLKQCFTKALKSLKLNQDEPIAVDVLVSIWKKYASPNGFNNKRFIKEINAQF